MLSIHQMHVRPWSEIGGLMQIGDILCRRMWAALSRGPQAEAVALRERSPTDWLSTSWSRLLNQFQGCDQRLLLVVLPLMLHVGDDCVELWVAE